MKNVARLETSVREITIRELRRLGIVGVDAETLSTNQLAQYAVNTGRVSWPNKPASGCSIPLTVLRRFAFKAQKVIRKYKKAIADGRPKEVAAKRACDQLNRERLISLGFTEAAISADAASINDENSFYRSLAWRRLRYDALTKAGGRCQCCGAFGVGVALHVDHVKPRSLWPELALDPKNLQVLCDDCNIGKGVRDQTDWRKSA